MNTFFGTLKDARFFLQNSSTSASLIELPSLGIMAQLICESIDKNLERKSLANGFESIELRIVRCVFLTSSPYLLSGTPKATA
ncbi:hypothetical protein IC582_022355 [Cucumis melo]